MGPPPDAQGLLNMMENPMFLSQMTEAMNNPDVIEMMTQSPMVTHNHTHHSYMTVQLM
jgi:ubiquilin